MWSIWYAGKILLQSVFSRFSFRSSGCFISEDLLIEILLRVPAEFVTKFRRLSKFHRDLIDSPDFRQKNRDLSNKRTDAIHILLDHKAGIRNACMIMKSDLSDFKVEFEDSINSFKRDGYSIVGTCVGIICLKLKYTSEVILWNPSTGSSRKINFPYVTDRFYSTYFVGHDAVNDDLKILRISHKDLHLNLPQDYECDIYSSNEDSWSFVSIGDDYNNRPILNLYSGGIFVEGSNSSHVIDPITLEDSIVAFNFCSHEFHKIPLPPGCSEFWPRHARVSSFDGCLCVYTKGCSNLSLWVMKEYGVEKSWTRLFCIDDFSIDMCPIPVQSLNDGRQLLLLMKTRGAIPEEYRMRVYDFTAKKLIRNRTVSPIELRTPKYFLFTPSLMCITNSNLPHVSTETRDYIGLSI